MGVRLYDGDNRDVLKTFLDDSIDSVVTDPPYGLSFMSKAWDYEVPTVDLWREILRVMKPGGWLLSFGGSRTYHRVAEAIEDGGFELHDWLAWFMMQGFPKSLNVAQAIDKMLGVVGSHSDGASGKGTTTVSAYGNGLNVNFQQRPRYSPGHEIAQRWQGWGTALKPAYEPIVVARKPGPSRPLGDVRLFYCGKARGKDRSCSKHPSVKPVALMRYLVRLVTPQHGIVLDPFAGSGTTGEAAVNEGFRAILIEREPEYLTDIRRRLAWFVEEEAA